VQLIYFASATAEQGLVTPIAQRSAWKPWNAHPFCWGSVPLGPNFTGKGQKYWCRSIGSWSHYNFATVPPSTSLLGGSPESP